MKYEITEEQIKELAKTKHAKRCVKKWFPEVFENKLEVGKWKKTPKKGLYCPKEKTEKGYLCYGFDVTGIWRELQVDPKITNEDIDATETEVIEALKNEAVKRGFVKGSYIKSLGSFDGFASGLDVFGYKGFYHYDFEFNTLYVNRDSASNIIIFENGKWANIVKTYTKEEAEKMLNAKIV